MTLPPMTLRENTREMAPVFIHKLAITCTSLVFDSLESNALASSTDGGRLNTELNGYLSNNACRYLKLASRSAQPAQRICLSPTYGLVLFYAARERGLSEASRARRDGYVQKAQVVVAPLPFVFLLE